ncbi:MAG: hypothetical protein PHC69_10190 [Ruminiclostridium sp.]|nr:hypothetical protein [Ruminiclostridium sp.]
MKWPWRLLSALILCLLLNGCYAKDRNREIEDGFGRYVLFEWRPIKLWRFTR